jgi:hypothetical protein
MAVWNGRPASLTTRRSPSQPGHLRGSCGLVDEDQFLRIEIELAVEPGYATAKDVRALLFGGMRRLF